MASSFVKIIQNYIHLDKETIESGETCTQICDPDSNKHSDYAKC